MEEKQIQQALSTAPAEIELSARNPDKSVTIGGEHLVLAPGYGASLMIDQDGSQRNGVMADYTTWQEKGGLKMSSRMLEIYEKRLQAYVQPDIDPGIKKDLERYIRSRTA